MPELNDEPTLFLALIAAALAATFAVLWWRRSRPRGRRTDKAEVWVLVDGSNVMHWQDNTASLAPVQAVVARLAELGYVPGVVFDANAGWKLQGRYLHDNAFARLLGLETRQVLVVEKGTQADPFLLNTAREFGARIVTNDRFRDWVGDYPEVAEPGLLVSGGMQEGRVWLKGIGAKEGAL